MTGRDAGPHDVSAAELAGRLAEVTANLDAYIAAAADRIAGPRIAAVEADAAEQLAGLRGAHEARLARADALEAELRRQLAAQLSLVARLRWTARYLPAPLRGLVLVDRPDAWAGDRPEARFAAVVDAAATAAGLVPYPAGSPTSTAQ